MILSDGAVQTKATICDEFLWMPPNLGWFSALYGHFKRDIDDKTWNANIYIYI